MLRQSKGFTLIELLVALALLVILSGALYGTFFSVTRARERAGARIDARREISSTLGTLRNEIASSFYRTLLSAPAAKSDATPRPPLTFVVEDRDNYGKPSSLIGFTTSSPPRIDSAPSSDVTAVQYFVREKEGALTLVRESKDLYLKVKSVPYPVIDTIDGFLVECYSGGKWVKSWNTELTHSLPDSVRITITLKDGEKFSTVATPGLKRKDETFSLPMLPGST